MSRLLVLQLKRIGDAVLTAPVLGAVRRICPEARITLALAGAAAELGPLFGMADEVLVWWPGRLNGDFLARVRTLRASAVLDFTGTDRSALVSLFSGAPVRAGYRKFMGSALRRLAWNVPCGASVRELHTIDFHHALAVSAGFPLGWRPGDGTDDAGHLRLPADLGGEQLTGAPGSYIHLHPGTAREEKFWPPERWAALLEYLHGKHGLPLVMTGGGGWAFEREQTERILACTRAPVTDLRGKLNLRELAAVAAGARVVLSVDTAAMHLAAAFRVPQIGLFGPTNPWHWAPRHGRAIILRAGLKPEAPPQPGQTGHPMERLAWEPVAEAADRLLAEWTVR